MDLFATPPEVDLTSDKLVGIFSMLVPGDSTVMGTKWGPRQAIICRVFGWEAGEVLELGTTPIFWDAVRNQLKCVTPQQPLVLGYAEKHQGDKYEYYAMSQRVPDDFDREEASRQLHANFGIG